MWVEATPMAKISEVPGITGETLALFEASGFGELRTFLDLPVTAVLGKLQEVNETYHLAGRLPSQTAILAWQKAARILEGEGGSRSPAGRGGLTATLVSDAKLAAAGIDLDAIPLAIPFGEDGEGRPTKEDQLHEAGFDLNEGRAEPAPSEEPGPAPQEQAKASDRGSLSLQELEPVPKALRKEDQPSGLVAVPHAEGGPRPAPSPAPLPSGPPEALGPRVGRSRAAVRVLADPQAASGSGSGAGEEPRSEPDESGSLQFRSLEDENLVRSRRPRRNRGMSHPLPRRVWLGAGGTLVACALFVVSGVGLVWGVLALVFAEWQFPPGMLWTLAGIPLGVLLYLEVATRSRCRLCGQRFFVPKRCQVHPKAPRSIFGHTIALAWEAFFRKAFHCVYCGTKTRLWK